MRDPQIARGRTALAASEAGARADLRPWDRVTGAAAVVRVYLSTPVAGSGEIFADVFVGGNLVAQNYLIPVEEFVGAGPNLRGMPIAARGGRGDSIQIVYRNSVAAVNNVDHHVEVHNAGR